MSCRTTAWIALAAMLPAGAAWAHHNMFPVFDINDRVTLTGTLSKIDWRNPHIELSIEVQSGGNAAEGWSLEGPSPSFFRGRDIDKGTFEMALGKTVTADASRARDGSRWGLLRAITLPDGRVVSACPQNC